MKLTVIESDLYHREIAEAYADRMVHLDIFEMTDESVEDMPSVIRDAHQRVKALVLELDMNLLNDAVCKTGFFAAMLMHLRSIKS
jgi:hypothetical protein